MRIIFSFFFRPPALFQLLAADTAAAADFMDGVGEGRDFGGIRSIRRGRYAHTGSRLARSHGTKVKYIHKYSIRRFLRSFPEIKNFRSPPHRNE